MELIRQGRKEEIQEKSVKIKLSQKEYDKLKALSEHEGLNMSAYIRQVAIHQAYNKIFNM